MAGRRFDRRRMVRYGIPAVALGLVAAASWYRSTHALPWDRAIDVPLAASPDLRDVVEPIAPTGGKFSAGSDDHWFGLTYRDARGVERAAKFVYYWPGFAGKPETKRTLILGKTRVAPSGPEERACLGLLERWWRGNAEAHALADRAERRDPTLRPTLDGYDGITPAQVGQLMAARLMRVLQNRN